MAIYRQIHVTFWEDPKVIEEMTPEDKYFFLYLLTNPHTTQIGIYRLSKKVAAFELGYSMDTISTLFERFENIYKIIKYNNSTKEIAIINWGKYNFNKGGKPIEDCVTKELSEVKDKELIGLLYPNISNNAIKSLFERYVNDTSTTSQRQDGNNNNNNNNNKKNKNNNNNDDSCDSLSSDSEFEAFWDAYPRQIEKKVALKCWNTRLKEKTSPEDMISAAFNYQRYCNLSKKETQYIKHPSTFLSANKPFIEWVNGIPPGELKETNVDRALKLVEETREGDSS